MIEINRFPGGKTRAVTFSYDDGKPNDARLIELFNRYAVKATFNLNGMNYAGKSHAELMAVRKQYEGHEIACHGFWHGDLNRMTAVSMVREIMEDRRILEEIAGYPVIGLAYPNGRWDDQVIEVLRSCGIVYGRTAETKLSACDLPGDFMKWPSSCHHRDARAVCEDFLKNMDFYWARNLLYIYGHSYEFRTEEDWRYMEEIVSSLAGNDRIWYATNIEIYRYVMAQRSLQISADESMIHNPSALPVWVQRDRRDVFRIDPGQTLRLDGLSGAQG